MKIKYPKTQDVVIIIFDHHDNKEYKSRPPSRDIFKDYYIFSSEEKLATYIEKNLNPSDKVSFFIHAMMDKNYNWVDGDFSKQKEDDDEKLVKPAIYFKNNLPELVINYLTKGNAWDAIKKYGQRNVFNYGELRKHFEQNEIKPQLVSEFYTFQNRQKEALAIKTGLQSKNEKYKDISAAIICALYKDEYTSLKQFVDIIEPVDGYKTLQYAKLIDSNKTVLIDFQAKMGMVDATSLSTQITEEFSPKYLIMVGVCGGRASKHVNLLDIIIPDTVYDYMTGKYENGVFEPYLRVSNLDIKSIKLYSDDIKAKMIQKCQGGLKSKCERINFHHNSLACGNVIVKTDGVLDGAIAKYDEQVVGVEMESYGVARAVELANNIKPKVLIIKSVMDFTEKDKNDNVKEDAAFLSACYTYYLVKDYL